MLNKLKENSHIIGNAIIAGVFMFMLCKAYVNQQTWVSWSQSDYYKSGYFKK